MATGGGELEKLTLASGRAQWWVQAVPATVEGRAETVIVATSLAQGRRTVNQLKALLAIGVPALVLASGLAAWAMVGRALRPVDQLRSEGNALASVVQRHAEGELPNLAPTTRLVDWPPLSTCSWSK